MGIEHPKTVYYGLIESKLRYEYSIKLWGNGYQYNINPREVSGLEQKAIKEIGQGMF